MKYAIVENGVVTNIVVSDDPELAKIVVGLRPRREFLLAGLIQMENLVKLSHNSRCRLKLLRCELN